jgi:hypothetical protein
MIGMVFKQAFTILFYPRDGFKKEWSSHVLAIYVGVLSLIPAIALFVELAMPATAGGAFLVNGKTITKPLILILLLLVTFFVVAWLIHIFAKIMAQPVSDMLTGYAQRRAIFHQTNIINVRHL